MCSIHTHQTYMNTFTSITSTLQYYGTESVLVLYLKMGLCDPLIDLDVRQSAGR